MLLSARQSFTRARYVLSLEQVLRRQVHSILCYCLHAIDTTKHTNNRHNHLAHLSARSSTTFCRPFAPWEDYPDTYVTEEGIMAGGGKWRFYGVAAGRKPGVYTDWPSVQAQVSGFSGARHKGFKTQEEAQAFVDGATRAFSTPISTPISLRGDASESASPSATRHVDTSTETLESAPKRQKKENTSPALVVDNSLFKFEPGLGPLPPDAVDGFDHNIKLDEQTGHIRVKTEEELGKRKRQPTGDFKGPVVVYTDGGSRGNGQKGAYAGCGVYFGPKDPRNVQEPLRGDGQTNNRAELVAMARAIDHVPIDRDLHIISDSEYSKNCLTEWFRKWEKNGWKINGKEVANKEIIQPILATIREREKSGAKTKITWIKAHAKDQGNIAADSLANQGMDKWTADLASGEVFDMSETLRTKYRNPNDPPSPKQEPEFGDTDSMDEYFRELAYENLNGFQGDPLAQDVLQSSADAERGDASAGQDIDDAWADDAHVLATVNGEEKKETGLDLTY